MAIVNALFPPVTHLEDDEDHDPSPYSVGLRETIRFTFYQHLLSEDPFSPAQFESIRMKLISWCNTPSYEDLRHTLIRYGEESRKLEQASLGLLNAFERRESSLSASTHGKNSKGKSSTEAQSPGTGVTSFDSRDSGVHKMSRVPSAPPVPNPLIRGGMPGREIVGAHTDPGAFIASVFGEKKKPPKCGKLSKTEYHHHPLAKHLELTSAEEAQLGMLLPKESSCNGP